MNNKKLLKTILISLLIFALLTWIIKTGSYTNGTYTEGSLEPLGLFDLIYYPLQSFQTFVQYGVYLLVVGGFYGILKKTGVYNNLVGACAKEKNRTSFLIITVIVLALLSSILGIMMGLFILVPFFKDVLEALGYDKKNAMLATVGSIFVGIIGSLLAFDVSGYINYFYQVEYTSLLVFKIAILLILSTLLIIYIKKSNTEFSPKKIEQDKTVKTMPAIVIALIAIIVGFISMFSWSYAFNIGIFNDLHSAISEIKVNGFSIISGILGQNIKAIGMCSEVEFSAVLLIASIAIAWIYGLKIKDTYDGFVEGSKKLLPMSIFTTLSFVILMPFFTSQTGQSIIYTVFNKIIGLSKEVSILPMTILSSVGTFFYGQFIYLASDLSTVLQTAYSDGYSLMTFIMQTIYGLTLFVTPTSALLLGGLSYFDVGYKEWIKHIYKFVLITLGILLITFLIIGWVI